MTTARANLRSLLLRSRFSAALLGLGVFGALTVAGCGESGEPTGGESDDGIADTLDGQVGKADGTPRPVGSFTADPSSARGAFTRLVLKTDQTFHDEVQVYCIRAPCPPLSTDGKYTFTRSGNTRYIRFVGERGRLIDRFAYRYAGDALELRRINTRDWFTLVAAEQPWCGTPDDCSLQNLRVPRCVGLFECNASACNFDCGGGGPPPQCQPVLCELYCEYGFKTDDTGCEVCSCAEPPTEKTCVVSGCSGQICGEESFITTCEFLPEYACYQSAGCARQTDGKCGWTPSPELTQCLADAGGGGGAGGESCGHLTCGAGQVCCNSLSGICTAPGDFCAF